MKKDYNVFNEVSIKDIRPKGWLKKYLENQASGLTGHLEYAGFPFNLVGWDRFDVNTTTMNDNPGWWAYEQTAYWVDGMEKCGELIDDEELIQKANKSFRFVLDHADEDGYMGPSLIKNTNGWNNWPHVVFFRAMMAKYSATKDPEILEKITNHYLNSKEDLSYYRDVLNVEIMLWAYRINGNKKLLELAEKTYEKYNEWATDDNCVKALLSRKKPYAHGVTYNEFCKLGAILYSCTGKKKYLKPVINAYKKMERYQMLIDGCPCSNEFMIDSDYMQSHETCDVTDYTWTLGYLLMATGDGKYADMIEKCVFNAGIGSALENFRGTQYFSCPNQLVLDSKSNHNDFFKGKSWMSYRPNPGTECCAGNVNRFFPNYCSRMWMKKDNKVFAALYGASSFGFDLDGKKVSIEEKTNYPFSDDISFEFSTETPTSFEFALRIPTWCDNPEIFVNGEKIEFTVSKGFVTIDREFKNGDTVKAVFHSELKMVGKYKNATYFEKGVLLYTYAMKGERIVDTEDQKCGPDFPALNIYPDKPWNYALSLDDEDIKNIKITEYPMTDEPWSIDSAPIKISVTARKVNGWKLKKSHRFLRTVDLYKRKKVPVEGDFTFTPRLPKESLLSPENLGEKETIELIPYGAGKLRLTVIPNCKTK